MQAIVLSMLVSMLGCDDGVIDKTCEDTEQGCDDGGASDDTAGDSDGFTEIDPVYGSDAGGSVVSISVNGLSGDPRVSFGGEEAVVLSYDGDEAVVETPAFDLSGEDMVLVDVEVSHNGSSQRLKEAFTYHRDRQNDVQFELLFERTHEQFEVDARHYNAPFPGMAAHLPERDECVPVLDYVESDHLALDVDGTSMQITEETTGIVTSLIPNETSVGLPYDSADRDFMVALNAGEGLVYGPADLVRAGERMNPIDPAHGSHDLLRQNQTLTWDVPESAGEDSFVYIAGIQASEVEIHCIAKDDGFFRVQAGKWRDFVEGEAITFEIYRFDSVKHVLPWNNANFLITSVSSASIYGTGAPAE